MNEADRDAVGFVGFAAWRAGEAFDAAYLDSCVIERVRSEFESFAKSPTGDVVVAEIDGDVVGWGACDVKPHHISDLWVNPAWQGKGIGKALIVRFLDRMRAEGLPLATIDTHANNRNAIGLYERCGFQIVWRGMEWSEIMKVDLEKVKLEQKLSP
ncbi:acetyltransferase [Agrobacterium tumefaciens]|uniref:Acetyltransferase n=2 Tax=Agrobacterium tumefaciens TaxID=358 RepID=A0A176WWF0_AGRTU|nr:acetyltransferase [Agrobacterium tumefaciens]